MTDETSFIATWKTSNALFTEALGRNKYRKALTALCELISNSLDAGSTTITVTLERNDLGGLDRLVIIDNGTGMSRKCIGGVFTDVGNQLKVQQPLNPLGRSNIGKHGVGRFSVFRLGAISHWSTVARENEHLVRYEFTLSRSDATKPLAVSVSDIDPEKCDTGTSISIENVSQKDIDPLFEDDEALRLAIFSAFAIYLTQYPDVGLAVNGTRIDAADYVEKRHKINVEIQVDNARLTAAITHILWKPDVRVDHDAVMVLSSHGRIVSERTIAKTLPGVKYAAFVESPTIDELVTSNWEDIKGMDPLCVALLEDVEKRCRAFVDRQLEGIRASFIERARTKPYYPYQKVQSVAEAVNQMVYDQFLETVNAEVSVESAPEKHQRLIYRLLKKALENHDLLAVLEEVSALSNEDARAFRELLEHVTLSSVIRVSTMLADRVAFLDNLKQLVYCNDAKYVRERSQLHKLIEPHTWVFGERFNLAASDQSFRSIVAAHRQQVGLNELTPEEMSSIRDVNRIPDLFLAATKFEEFTKTHHHLIVELKAPRVKIGRKEIAQVKDYALVISESPEFDKHSTQWEFMVVSSDIQEKAEWELTESKDHRPGCDLDREDCRIFVRRWGELVDERRAELDFATSLLQQRTENLEELDYFRRKFGELLPASLRKAPATHTRG